MQMFLCCFILCIPWLLKLKQYTENLTSKLQNSNQNSTVSWVSLIGLWETRPRSYAFRLALIYILEKMYSSVNFQSWISVIRLPYNLVTNGTNRPFPSSFVPLFQSESRCETSSITNDFDLHENETAFRTHFHKKGFALRLVLKKRDNGTRKWPIRIIFYVTGQKIRYKKVLPRYWTGSGSRKKKDKAVSFRIWSRKILEQS